MRNELTWSVTAKNKAENTITILYTYIYFVFKCQKLDFTVIFLSPSNHLHNKCMSGFAINCKRH